MVLIPASHFGDIYLLTFLIAKFNTYIIDLLLFYSLDQQYIQNF